jgi:hypothetical protein
MTLPFHAIYNLNDWNVTQSTETSTSVCKNSTTYEISLGIKRQEFEKHSSLTSRVEVENAYMF